jgi:phosphoglycerate dehydrogenase-like enzyme
MDVLIVDPLDGDVLHWLSARHALQVAPEFVRDTEAFHNALMGARAVVVPPGLSVDALALRRATRLLVVARLSVGVESIDIEACARAGVEVVRPATAGAAAQAEFVVGALLQLLRRVPVLSREGVRVGRELGGSTVGVVGLTPAVRHLVPLLTAFGAVVVGHDPGVQAADTAWSRYGVEPIGLRELMATCDAVCVLLSFMPRYLGLFNERLFMRSRPDQVLVSLAHSSLFDEPALARALGGGPLAAAWFDNADASLVAPGRPLSMTDKLQITPGLAGATLQSRTRSAWAVARRIDERLSAAPPAAVLKPKQPGDPAAPAGVSAQA